jgi:hypothetical protein
MASTARAPTFNEQRLAPTIFYILTLKGGFGTTYRKAKFRDRCASVLVRFEAPGRDP